MECFFQSKYTEGMEKNGVGALIREHRKAAGLTQEELGDAIEFTGRRVSEWESGRAVPSRDAIGALARVFRISADEFLRRMHRDPELDKIIAEEEERKHGHGPERMRAQHILEDLIDRPVELEQWLTYGEYLLNRSH